MTTVAREVAGAIAFMAIGVAVSLAVALPQRARSKGKRKPTDGLAPSRGWPEGLRWYWST